MALLQRRLEGIRTGRYPELAPLSPDGVFGQRTRTAVQQYQSLAGLAVGFWQSTDEVRALRVSDRVFSPERAQAECDEKYRLWKRAVSCACGWIEKA